MKKIGISMIALGLVLLTSVVSLAEPRDIQAGCDCSSDCHPRCWQGFYLGVNGGLSHHSSDWTDIDYDWFGSTMTLSDNSWTAGGTIGYNIQHSNTVFGIEADWNGTGNHRLYNYSEGEGNVDITNDLDWFGTVRARAGGLALDHSLFYLTGGIAYGNTTQSWIQDADPSDSWSSLGGSRFGWVVGVGFEHARTSRITIKSEFLYMNFADRTSTNDYGYRLIVDDGMVVARLGLNFR